MNGYAEGCLWFLVYLSVTLMVALGLSPYYMKSPIKTRNDVSTEQRCIEGKLYWIYEKPALGLGPLFAPVGDREGNHVECSEG